MPLATVGAIANDAGAVREQLANPYLRDLRVQVKETLQQDPPDLAFYKGSGEG